MAGAAQAQPYPSRPIRVVVPLSPGGFADVPTRMLLPRLSAALGRQLIVDNKPGAGSTIGADSVAKSAPDGYTLLVAATPHVISAHLYRTLPYDTLKDFAPVALFGSGPYALVVNAQKLPVATVREFIAAAKAAPGKIDYASSGNGSAQHLVSALFNTMAGIQLNHVPYKGSGPAMLPASLPRSRVVQTRSSSYVPRTPACASVTDYRPSLPITRSSGNSRSAPSTNATVAKPPSTTVGTGPMSAASSPDSNAPSSFDEPMKTRFTADTRPRSSSGVSSWTTVWRITTLTLSSAPATKSAASESQNHVESPKTMIASPNPATDHTSTRPSAGTGASAPAQRPS